MDKWRGKVAVVTGASSGIGAAIARALASRGLTVVALARRDDRLQKLADDLVKEKAPGKVHPRKADLRKEEDILAVFAWVDMEFGGADILVNNAGCSSPGYVTDVKTKDWRDMLDLNVLAVSICTREYLKSMEKRNNQKGHIFIVNSIAGHLAENPLGGMYSGSKHCIKAFSMCLRRELAEKNSTIKVTSVSPGLTNTEIFEGTPYEKIVKQLPKLEGEDVSKVIVDALSASDICQICEVVLNPVPTKIALY